MASSRLVAMDEASHYSSGLLNNLSRMKVVTAAPMFLVFSAPGKEAPERWLEPPNGPLSAITQSGEGLSVASQPPLLVQPLVFLFW